MDNMHKILKSVYGYDDFRPGQEKLISHILSGRDVLGIMPTGAGKSLCFQVPALLFPGLTIVISPLISLMQDQVQALKARGVRAETITSAMTRVEKAALLSEIRRQYTRSDSLRYNSPEGNAAATIDRFATPRSSAEAPRRHPSASRQSPLPPPLRLAGEAACSGVSRICRIYTDFVHLRRRSPLRLPVGAGLPARLPQDPGLCLSAPKTAGHRGLHRNCHSRGQKRHY